MLTTIKLKYVRIKFAALWLQDCFVLFGSIILISPEFTHDVAALRCLFFIFINIQCLLLLLFKWFDSLSGLRPPHCRGFTIILRHTTLGRTPLDKGSARRRDLYLTTHNTRKRRIFMPPLDSNPQSQQASCRRLTP
jgi:hypothetical protein